MKKNFFWVLSLALLSFTVMTTTTSCDPEETCVDANCGKGSCFDGGCICDVGYALDVNGFCTDCAEGYALDINGDCVPACEDANCPANAQCENNECVCIIGYEMNTDGACVRERDKFFGLYDVNDVCTSGTYDYEVTITELIDSPDVVRMENLAGLDCTDINGNPVPYFVEASVFESSLSFSDFETCGATFTGSATMDAGVISMTYSVANPDDDCTTTLTKK